MGEVSQKETKNDMRSLKTRSCGLKIINVFFNKRNKQGKLKRVEVQILELTGYQQRFLMG